MSAKKAMRRFLNMVATAPEGANFTVGVGWDEHKHWRVTLQIHTGLLLLKPDKARGLADIYDKEHAKPEWRNIPTGLRWVAPELRKLADECDDNNARKVVPPEALAAMAEAGHA